MPVLVPSLASIGTQKAVSNRVEFCVTRDPQQPVQTLRYVARVVTPGTYRWEGAVLQSTVVPDEGLVIDPVTVKIRGTGG